MHAAEQTFTFIMILIISDSDSFASQLDSSTNWVQDTAANGNSHNAKQNKKKAGALEQNKQWTSCIMSSGIFIKSSTFRTEGGCWDIRSRLLYLRP